MTPVVSALEDAGLLPVTSIGGKAWQLSRFRRYGFPVPRACVLTDAFWRTQVAPQLEPSLFAAVAAAADDDRRLPAACAAARDAIGGAVLDLRPVDDWIRAQARPPLTFAVRSSGVDEDGGEASFAGIHVSTLNVRRDDLPSAVLATYASSWSEEAVRYRTRRRLPLDACGMAVVIQEFVDGDVSGVAFTADPMTGAGSIVVIEAALGLGETVVRGGHGVDRFRVAINGLAAEVIEREVARKRLRLVAAEAGGVSTIPVNGVAVTRAVISDECARKIAVFSKRIEAAFSRRDDAVDVEWTYSRGELVLLQVRAAAGVAAPPWRSAATGITWSNASFKDAFPGVQSVLGWSVFSPILTAVLLTGIRASGYRDTRAGPTHRLEAGRPYYNLTLLQWMFYSAIGVTPRELNEALGGHQPEITVPPATWRERVARAARLLRLFVRGEGVTRRMPAEALAVAADLEAEHAAAACLQSPAQRLAACGRIAAAAVRFADSFQLANAMAGLWFRAAEQAACAAGATRSVAAALLADSRQVTSAELARQLAAVAGVAAADAAGRAALEAGAASVSALPAAGPFRAAFDRFLVDYGHRGTFETDPSAPRWGEDAAFLLDNIRLLVAAPPGELPARGRRAAAEREFADLTRRRPIRRLVARVLIERARKACALRELGKSTLIRFVAPIRAHALAVGERLTETGALPCRDDVFLCSWWDVVALIGGAPATGFAELLSERRQVLEKERRTVPPDVLAQRVSTVAPVDVAPEPYRGGAPLAGVAISPGIVHGPVRLITDPTRTAALRSGDVLVVPSLDPAWTPLCLRASALVLECGGMLSHGAIVARELGIPAVANVRDAMRVLADGDVVVVDGFRGTITRVGGCAAATLGVGTAVDGEIPERESCVRH